VFFATAYDLVYRRARARVARDGVLKSASG
jgi:hypothetical protein